MYIESICRTVYYDVKSIVETNRGQYGPTLRTGEFIKLICGERFFTDLVRYLINPTTDRVVMMKMALGMTTMTMIAMMTMMITMYMLHCTW